MSYEKLSDFAKTFPVLRDYAPAEFFDKIDKRDFEGAIKWLYKDGGATYWAVIFVISVWNPSTPEKIGLKPFDMHKAIPKWDNHQLKAFGDWAKAPFYF